jgi:hypothetical protein
VDGTRDRPPGKTAENWGRKDGIRAGSVSGPWRSAPRENDSAHGQPHRAGPPRPEQHGVHGYQPDALDSARAQRAANSRDHAHRSAMMVMWIIFGIFVAIGAVILAFVFQPDLAGSDTFSSNEPPASGQPGSGAADGMPVAEAAKLLAPAPGNVPAESVEAATAADPEPAAAVADTALAVVSDLRLRVGPGFPDARRQAIVAALEQAGITAVQVEALPFRIATSRVGYYRAEDLSTAQALVRLISPVLAEGQEIGVRDYSQLLSDPVPGRLDLWVGS